MSQAVAFGSISIIDVTDLGEFSVQPMSNMPLSVVYDPDSNSFTPNWKTNNLVITPSVWYAGTELTLGTSGLTITWQRQVGSDSYTALVSGETIVDNGKLKVSANKFTSSSTMLTYIVTANYTEPTTQQVLTSKGQVTFTLIKNASKVKNCTITGESVFKYDTTGTIVGTGTITLNAEVNTVSISGWKYQNSSGTFVTYPGSSTNKTLTVTPDDTLFVNDRCVIKCETSDSTVYDIHTITKLRDGAAGTDTVSAVLTNDSQMVPYDSSGKGDFTSATSRIIIYEGGINTTNTWKIEQSYSNVTASASKSSGEYGRDNDTVTVTGFDTGVSTGNVLFTCSKTGKANITKTFSLVKVTAGADGKTPVIYSVEADTVAMNRSEGGTLNPETVVFRGFQQEGTTKTAYSGRFKIFENITYQEYIEAETPPAAIITTDNDASSYEYTPNSTATSILCILFAAGSTTTILDSQSVIIANDGKTGLTGATGDDGAAAINVIFGNYSDVLNCTSDNKLIAQQYIRIPFAAYEGTERIACEFTTIKLLSVSPQSIGTGTNNSAYASTTADGRIVWNLPAAKAISSSGGTLNITFTAKASTGDVKVTQTYTWTRTTAATNGQNAVLLQIFTPSGTNVFNQSTSSITMQATLMEGATDATANATFQWAQWENGDYVNVSKSDDATYGKTSSLSVSSDAIDSYGSFRCTATYTPTGGSQTTYTAYFSLFDKTDPIQVSVFSSIGEQIINGQGVGALYVKVTRLGQEIDSLYSERFLQEAPTSPTTGDYYYHLDKTTKTVTLKQWSGSAWADVENPYTGTYTWSWRDKDGNAIANTANLPTSGKVVYIDGSMIDTKIIADVGVTIQ